MQVLNLTYRIEKADECGTGLNWMLICSETGLCIGTRTKKEAIELMENGGWEIVDKWELEEPVKCIDKYGSWIEYPIGQK